MMKQKWISLFNFYGEMTEKYTIKQLLNMFPHQDNQFYFFLINYNWDACIVGMQPCEIHLGTDESLGLSK